MQMNEWYSVDQLVKNQGVQFPLADAYSHLRAAEALIYQACWLYENGKPCGAEANMAKLRGSEAGFRAVDAAIPNVRRIWLCQRV